VLKLESEAVPVTARVPLIVVLLVMLAEFNVAAPVAANVVVLTPPFAVRLPPTVALFETLTEFSVARPEVLKVDRVVLPVTPSGAADGDVAGDAQCAADVGRRCIEIDIPGAGPGKGDIAEKFRMAI
jgi:hypothetical protein